MTRKIEGQIDFLETLVHSVLSVFGMLQKPQ